MLPHTGQAASGANMLRRCAASGETASSARSASGAISARAVRSRSCSDSALGDLAAGRAYLLRRGGELRLSARQVRRCANMLFAGCTRLAQGLEDALEICFAFVQRWLIDRRKSCFDVRRYRE